MRFHARDYAYLVAAWMAAFAALSLGATPALAQKRFAFVIGNGGYANVTKLPNALNDAGATRAMLQEAGFDITPALDLSLAGLRSALDVFVDKVRHGGPDATALVYYAGHAVQLDGANYILPTDIRPQIGTNIAEQSLSLSDILRRLDGAGAKSKIAILDACRDNPFAGRQMARGLALQIVDGANDGVSSEAGLARIDSGSGTFVAFATSPGSTAADGTGANSPFTTAFLREAREPGLAVEQIFRRIRLAVYDSTNGTQIPWDTSSLITEFSFFQRPAGAPAAQPATAGNVPLTARPTLASLRGMSPADAARTAIAWDRSDIYGNALAINPEDQNALRLNRILAQRTDERAWAEAVLAGDAESFKLYARLYPVSEHTAAALRLAATAPSRNRVQVAQTCPVCPAVQQPRTRRADYTPRGVSPAHAGAPRQAPVTPPYAPPPPPAGRQAQAPEVPTLFPERPRWTGFYAGGSLGGGRQSGNTRIAGPFGSPTIQTSTTVVVSTTPVLVTATVPGPTIVSPAAINPAAVPGRLSPDGSGTVGGAQFGFNYQIGAVVIGAETDLSATKLGGGQTTAANPGGTRFTTRAENEVSMLGTVRARAGFVLGDFMIYGSGGYAYGLVDQKGSIRPDNPATTSGATASRSGLASGWALGGGVEYAILPGMTLRLDYTHYDLGNQKLTLQDYTGLAPTQYATMRARTAGDIVKAGFNFGF
ncbi:caspase family protein [uncultured Bosea sp.]|uniref:caspase family protein n=1 Tax=uncultured Bosea sp. TaxID=211457 RepID=UPI0025EAB503|nr:caspase family protein [uncultured Bosea sp.]